MDNQLHVSICICTYNRLKLLRDLLTEISLQETDGTFTYSVIVVDNDVGRSAEKTVQEASEKTGLEIIYEVEPVKGIPRARNKAVKNSRGDFVAFIDDDEVPTRNWLTLLISTYLKYDSDGVLGPVIARFVKQPPRWAKGSDLFTRPRFSTGHFLHWKDTRTGNVLFHREIFLDTENLFNESFKHGEDKELFHRLTERGFVFVWCDEALFMRSNRKSDSNCATS